MMKQSIIMTLVVLTTWLTHFSIMATTTPLSIEELRLDKARQSMPEVFKPLSKHVTQFADELDKVSDDWELQSLIRTHANLIWRHAVASLKEQGDWDDRPLYWARLEAREAIKSSPIFQSLAPYAQATHLWSFEMLSRGQGDDVFSDDADIKILITGFDPFFLDRNIDQSNPSGVAAMWLDGKEYDIDGLVVEIQALVVPVRFADFDKGMIETLLAPHFPEVDMIATISMGRSDFDLERFPGKRRSAEAPDNRNILTGASAENPLIPFLNDAELDGPEFVEFSLPVADMQKAEGRFKIIDNRKVTTPEGELFPTNLTELSDQVAVTGGGGGYLSNEISYRSILLRNKLRPDLPVGHIHTPRIKAFEPDTTAQIVKQVEQMLILSVPGLAKSN